MGRKAYRFAWNIGLAFVIILTPFLQIGMNKSQAAGSSGVRTEVEFHYEASSDGQSWFPQITVYKGDFSTGITTTEKYTYTEKAISKKGDFNNCSEQPYLIKRSNGYVAYWNTCHPIKWGKSSSVTSLLLSFDLTTQKWEVVAETPGLNITFFPVFGAYTTMPPYESSNTNRKSLNAKTYDLTTKKLLLTSVSVPNEEGDSLRYIVYREQTGIDHYSKKPFKYEAHVEFKLDKQGRKTEISEVQGVVSQSEKKIRIGKLTYTGYKDTKKKEDFYGYYKDNKFTPLDDPGYSSAGSFSPNNKYLIITMFPNDRNKWAHTVEYKTKIVEAKTGKILYVLPMYANINYYHFYDWNYGDELVRVNFWTDNMKLRNGYLNLKTGIYTQALDNAQENDRTHHFYKYDGKYEELLSPLTPPHLTVDGKTVVYHGQGAFVAENGKWFVGVQDFADSIGGTVSLGTNDLTLKAGGRSVTIALANTVAAFGKRYASINDLGKGLGYVTALYNGREQGPRNIALYSARFTEEQFLSQNPEAKMLDSHNGYYKLNAGAPEFVSEDSQSHSYRLGGYTDIITFKDGKLQCIESEISLDAMDRRIERFEPMKNVLKAYGTGKKYTLNVRWGFDANIYAFPSQGYTRLLVFQNSSFDSDIVIIEEASPSTT
ncbi:hypothetical protein GE107_14220 [Cohnella sp. CFH 77786]|uniref:hypothetical protein n=1 Tax=Cohnella sp. CFH 77786 TaxID=2662265 RepID=UPI001C60D3F7|nr:hypothetical protein [Cohnella sp. CFH 77786]MBW5447209.1 hypothetical protein [Cohnella sp. CFH 77786]